MNSKSVSRCRSCNEEIRWITTPAGKQHPINAKPNMQWVLLHNLVKQQEEWNLLETYESHFATCPQGKLWSKKDKK